MGSTAGYSGTPLIRKLGLEPGHRAVAIGPPDGFAALLGREIEVVGRTANLPAGTFDYLHLFVADRAALAAAMPALRAALDDAGMLWISWPKKASGVRSDLSEDAIRELALATRLVDVKVCAIDAVWSGLKLVIPRALRGRR